MDDQFKSFISNFYKENDLDENPTFDKLDMQ